MPLFEEQLAVALEYGCAAPAVGLFLQNRLCGNRIQPRLIGVKTDKRFTNGFTVERTHLLTAVAAPDKAIFDQGGLLLRGQLALPLRYGGKTAAAVDPAFGQRAGRTLPPVRGAESAASVTSVPIKT